MQQSYDSSALAEMAAFAAIADAHGRWQLADERRLGVDRLEGYERVREA